MQISQFYVYSFIRLQYCQSLYNTIFSRLHTLFRLFPININENVFESYVDKQYSCSSPSAWSTSLSMSMLILKLSPPRPLSFPFYFLEIFAHSFFMYAPSPCSYRTFELRNPFRFSARSPLTATVLFCVRSPMAMLENFSDVVGKLLIDVGKVMTILSGKCRRVCQLAAVC